MTRQTPIERYRNIGISAHIDAGVRRRRHYAEAPNNVAEAIIRSKSPGRA